MRIATTLAAVTVAVTLTLLPALSAGRHTHRWGITPELAAAAEKLPDFPRVLGDWQCVADTEPLSERVCQELGLANHIGRIYRHTHTGDEVTLLLMVGQPGPLVRHPPDICYGNRANRLMAETKLVLNVSDQTHSLSKLDYQRLNSPGGEHFTVCYAYLADDSWATPDLPRITYGASPYLFKVQILANGFDVGRNDDDGESYLIDFAKAFAAQPPC